MDYETFDALSNKKTRNQIVAMLKKEAHTFDEIANAVKLDISSVFYHIKEMEKEGKVIKRFVGKVTYIGLTPKER